MGRSASSGGWRDRRFSLVLRDAGGDQPSMAQGGGARLGRVVGGRRQRCLGNEVEAVADSGGAAWDKLLATCSCCGPGRPRQAASIVESGGEAAADSDVTSPGRAAGEVQPVSSRTSASSCGRRG